MNRTLLQMKLKDNPIRTVLNTKLKEQMKLSDKQVKLLQELEEELKDKVEKIKKKTSSTVKEALNSRRAEVVSTLAKKHQDTLKRVLLDDFETKELSDKQVKFLQELEEELKIK